jgi:hypothetical protein
VRLPHSSVIFARLLFLLHLLYHPAEHSTHTHTADVHLWAGGAAKFSQTKWNDIKIKKEGERGRWWVVNICWTHKKPLIVCGKCAKNLQLASNSTQTLYPIYYITACFSHWGSFTPPTCSPAFYLYTLLAGNVVQFKLFSHGFQSRIYCAPISGG